MLEYYANLLFSSIQQIPGSLGSNWLGLIFPALVVTVGEALACWSYGWRTMIAKWRQATIIGFAALGFCYLALFVWCAISTNYKGYAALSESNSTLKILVDSSDSRQRYAVLQAQSECAKTLGKNEILAEQNRDQQNTISHCQEDAIKFIAGDPLLLRPVLSSRTRNGDGSETQNFLLLTNKKIEATRVQLYCDEDITSIQIMLIALDDSLIPLWSGGPLIAGRRLIIPFQQIGFTPTRPLLLDYTLKQNSSGLKLNCKYQVM